MRAVDDANGAVGNQDVVNLNIPCCIWHMQRIVKDCHGGRAGESAEIPIDVMRQHNRRRLIKWDGDKAGSHLASGERICRVGDNISREAFIGQIEE